MSLHVGECVCCGLKLRYLCFSSSDDEDVLRAIKLSLQVCVHYIFTFTNIYKEMTNVNSVQTNRMACPQYSQQLMGHMWLEYCPQHVIP